MVTVDNKREFLKVFQEINTYIQKDNESEILRYLNICCFKKAMKILGEKNC